MAKRRLLSVSKDPTPSPVEVVVFEDPSKKRLKAKPKPADEKTGGTVSFDWHKARHEVFKFGITGLEEKDEKDAKVSLAVKLGAKPPRNKYINYKDLMQERKQQREEKKIELLESGNDRYKLKPLTGKKKKQTGQKDRKTGPE